MEEANESEETIKLQNHLIQKIGKGLKASPHEFKHKRCLNYCTPNYNAITSDEPFNKFKIEKIRSILHKIEVKERTIEVLEGKRVDSLDSFNDETLDIEFTQQLGHINEGELRAKLFIEFKSSRLDDIRKWKEYEKNLKREIRRNPEKSMKRKEWIHYEIDELWTILHKIQPKATIEEKFIANPEKNNHKSDFFILPRAYKEFFKNPQYLERNRRTGTFTFQESTFTRFNGDEEKNYTGFRKLNLAIYDPKVSEFNLFNLNDYKGEYGEDIFPTIGKLALVNLANIIYKYPIGICIDQFIIQFDLIQKYRPLAGLVDFKTLIEFLEDIFYIQNFENKTILFPAILKYNIEPIHVFVSKIWHFIRIVMVRYDFILPLDVIPEQMLKWYKITMINLVDWGISMEEFIQYCIEQYGKETFKIVTLVKGPYLISLLLKRENRKYAQRLENFIDENRVNPPSILYTHVTVPQNMVQPEEKPIYISNLLNPGMIQSVVVVRVEALSSIVCILEKNWNILIEFQLELQDHFNNNRSKEMLRSLPLDDSKIISNSPRYNSLQTHMLVAFLPCESSEWFRGRITKIFVVDENDRADMFYNIYQIDFGVTSYNVPIGRINFLPRKYLDFEAQAISCFLEITKERPNKTLNDLSLISGREIKKEWAIFLSDKGEGSEKTPNQWKSLFLHPSANKVKSRKSSSRVSRQFGGKKWVIQLNKFLGKTPNRVIEESVDVSNIHSAEIIQNIGREFFLQHFSSLVHKSRKVTCTAPQSNSGN